VKSGIHNRLQWRLFLIVSGLLLLGGLWYPVLFRLLHHHFTTVFLAIYASGLIGLVFATWMGVNYLARKIASPLRILRDAMCRLNGGDTGVRVFFKHGDEVNEISDEFNYLAEKFASERSEHDRDRDLLDALLITMEEGVCLCDPDGHIRFANNRFDTMTGRLRNPSLRIYEIVRQADLIRMLHKAFEQHLADRAELTWDDRHFLASTAYLETHDYVAVTLRDITETVRNRQAHRDFLQNVTHELKTPLTSIRSFVELLRDEVELPSAQGYLDTIERNNERLIRIVADLLQITRGEEGGIERNPVELNRLVETAAKPFREECRQRGLELVIEPADGSPVIQGDGFRLEQALSNLVQNAINYTDRGEIRLTVHQRDGELSLCVRDSGLGIAHQHLPYLFDRFYVVDASRSRKNGGTGLGLAIVRQIAISHGGRVEVESTLGVGSEFRIVLPSERRGVRNG
jgi:signal transduction histidine kinase